MRFFVALFCLVTISVCFAGKQKCPNGCKKGIENKEEVSKIVANLPPSQQELAENHKSDYVNVEHNDDKANNNAVNEDGEGGRKMIGMKRGEYTTRKHRFSLKYKSKTDAPMMRSFKKRLNHDENKLIKDSNKSEYIARLLQSRYVVDKRDIEDSPKEKPKHLPKNHGNKDINADAELQKKRDQKEKLFRNMRVLVEGVKKNLDDYSHLKKKK